MDEHAPLRLTVMVEPGIEPIRGCVWNGTRCEPFCGWLQLSAAIERARDALAGAVEEQSCQP